MNIREGHGRANLGFNDLAAASKTVSPLQPTDKSLEVVRDGRLEDVLVDVLQRVSQDESDLGLRERQAVRNGPHPVVAVALRHGVAPAWPE
jgi:hypothetical protein